ncbi:recombination-associated protein RdgC [Piscinibacter sp.]|uniref:recombination-associated protein RdgC n=1 Tax=Piscinibacter sp. TaxID=1903157 RepID=UPI002CE58C20|nr:recombination-associated protein RdgC [Albitalea sp.]HUG22321.1 recombination-associated protein RdgC [Albitalea sp.]
MFKNTLVYRIGPWDPPALTALEDRLAAARFTECGATQMESAGWVEPRGEKHGPLIESVGGQWMLKLCTETKAVPGGVVRNQLEERLAKAEAETGRRPKGKHAKEIKEDIVHALLPRAFPKRTTTPIWIDLRAQLVIIGAASMKKADAIVTRLVELLGGGIVLRPLQTELSPATAMAEWLKQKEAPPGFSIDRECELKQPDSEKSTVRYARHTLEIDEVAEHIGQGKLPTQVAMTFGGRVSFVLTEAMALKKIKLLDVVLEGAGTAGKQDNGFDADVAIATGELGPLIAGLVEALGGELEREKPPEALAA